MSQDDLNAEFPLDLQERGSARAARLAEKIAAQRKHTQEGEDIPTLGGVEIPLSPMETLHHRFPTALRGYRKEDVHEYLQRMSQQLEAHLQERAELQQRIQELQQRVEQYREAEDELRRTVVAAERISHELREQTKREAQTMLQDAKQKAQLLSEQALSREREALLTHDARMTELESAFAQRRSQLEQQYQQREHALEARARERSAQLEREFSARYAELSGRLTSAHAEYANFMAQYRAVSQAFAQAANTQLLPENPALLGPDNPPSLAQGPDNDIRGVLVEEQRFGP